MYHYLFTNDLRISKLNTSLVVAGKCFVMGTVPSATEDKSANNNMKTLGFYFNLTDDSVCAQKAADGKVKEVVINFIKKFQFPNMRTQESYDNCVRDKITLAPMRAIVGALDQMHKSYGSIAAHLSREEIKYFIFYNDAVAKTTTPDYAAVAKSILDYRKTKRYPSTVSVFEVEHEWKQEERQIREMVKILKWSGLVLEEEDQIFIPYANLSPSEKAEIIAIVNYKRFWKGDCIESYRRYMDIS